MYQKRKGVLALEGKTFNTAEVIVLESSPESKRKKVGKGLMNTKDLADPVAKKRSVQSVKKKQDWVSSSFDSFVGNTVSKLPASGGTFWKEKSDVEARSKLSSEASLLWCDRYSPLSEADLAVHKKKVAEVRDWLLAQLTSKAGCGVLLLTGPPGAGKTATLRVLAREISVDIQEWINPTNPMSQNDFVESDWRNYEDMVRPESQQKRFRNFFLRANKYPCLSLGASDVNMNKKIVLIEDMPNLFYRNPAELHDLLRVYQRTSRNPVVFIVSDSNNNDINAYRLFPRDVIQTLGISTISFNPASVTNLNKLANKIVSSEAQKRHVGFQSPSKEVIDSLVSGSNGDIRGMINNLQFACLKGCSATFQKQKHLKRTRSKRENKASSGKSKKDPEMEMTSLPMIGGKDTSIYLFRVLGKILYCKRDENSETTTSSLPVHLKHHERRPLLENPESVFEKSHMSGDNLTLYLHQNYTDFLNNIEDVSTACGYLSDADYLAAEWMNRSTLSCYTPCLSIRGLMFCNQSRQKTQGKGGLRPFHKPHWYTVFKQARNNTTTAIDLFQNYTRNTGQLHCEIIPYLALSDVPLKSPGQITYCETVRKFSKNFSSLRNSKLALQENEIDDQEIESSALNFHAAHRRTIEKSDLVLTPQTVEEDDIEEFQD